MLIIDPNLHKWSLHPAIVGCNAFSDDRFISCAKSLLDEAGCGGGGAQFRFALDQDPGEAPIVGVEVILADEEYIVPLMDLYVALYLESVARHERKACAGIEAIIAKVRHKIWGSDPG